MGVSLGGRPNKHYWFDRIVDRILRGAVPFWWDGR